MIDGDDVIESYKYGSELITVTDEDKAEYKYDAGPKRMSVLGFVSQESLPRQCVLGDGCMAFQPQPEDEAAAVALSSLAYAMYDMGQAAVVRRVYRLNSAPRMGVLVPEYQTDDDGNSEMVISLLFCKDERPNKF